VSLHSSNNSLLRKLRAIGISPSHHHHSLHGHGQHQAGSVDSSSSALTPEGAGLDLNSGNFHVFSEDLMPGVGADGMDGMSSIDGMEVGLGMGDVNVDILHSLTPHEDTDYLGMHFGHGNGISGEKTVPGKEVDNEKGDLIGSGSGSEKNMVEEGMDLDDNDRDRDRELTQSDGSGTSADSPLARSGEHENEDGVEERGRSREWLRTAHIHPESSSEEKIHFPDHRSQSCSLENRLRERGDKEKLAIKEEENTMMVV